MPSFSRPQVAVFLAFFAIVIQSPHAMAFQESDQWIYHQSDNGSFSGGTQQLWLTEEMPNELQVKLGDQIAQMRYSEFQYGSPASRFVSVALLENDSETSLYIDLNRDRKIQADELVPKTGNHWLVELAAEFPVDNTGEPNSLSRQVRFELSRFGESIRYSTVGYLVGKSGIPGTDEEAESRALSIRVSDSDGNGKFGDVEDMIWVDTNLDGKFDPFLEKTKIKNGLVFDERRYQFVTDETGSSIELNLVEGTGRIEFLLDVSAEVISSNMTLVSKDGIVVPLVFEEYAEAAEASVPVGMYRISGLSICLRDPLNQEKWHYTFSAMRKGEDAVWFPVSKNKTTEISPVEQVDFALQFPEQDSFPEGSLLTVAPSLTTKSGLYINNCWQGEATRAWIDDGRGATIRLTGSNLKQPVVTTSGFR